MNYLSLITLVCFAVVLVNASESGYYVPKRYYIIHSDGHQPLLSKISPSHQLRLHRSPQFPSSSSSSSSSLSSNGGLVYFHQSTSSHVSPGGYHPGVVGSINNRFNGDANDDDDHDDIPLPFKSNNRPSYSSSQIQTETFAGNGYQSTLSLNGIKSQNTGNTVLSQSSSISRPTGHGIQTQSTGALYPSPNGNVVFTQWNNNGVYSQTSGIIYPNGQVH